ncbi:PhnF Transcriptional regulators [Rhabdaerophilaceae bacterium]
MSRASPCLRSALAADVSTALINTIPAYRRIMQVIREEIASGALKPGARVPSEHRVVERFSVSRMTANRALRELAQEGLIVRAAGSGSFVAEKRLDVSLLVVPDIAEDIVATGLAYTGLVISAAAMAAPADLAEALGLEIGATVFRSLIIHQADGKPVQLEDRYVNPAFAPDYLGQDFTTTTPNAYLTTIGRVSEVEQTIEAIAASPLVSKRLAIPRNAPCLRVTRRTWSLGRIATSARLIAPGQNWRLTARFRPGG